MTTINTDNINGKIESLSRVDIWNFLKEKGILPAELKQRTGKMFNQLTKQDLIPILLDLLKKEKEKEIEKEKEKQQEKKVQLYVKKQVLVKEEEKRKITLQEFYEELLNSSFVFPHSEVDIKEIDYTGYVATIGWRLTIKYMQLDEEWLWYLVDEYNHQLNAVGASLKEAYDKYIGLVNGYARKDNIIC